MRDINRLRRFIVLVDAFYDNKVKFILLAEAQPLDLLNKLSDEAGGDSQDTKEQTAIHMRSSFDELYAYDMQKNVDEIFAFDRTVSRLLEMQSVAYLEEATTAHDIRCS
mmetsp:Transcript_18318/g.23870  ORF Transcript_18318/g.23870 Transcript_18318/m.23870 type:complete len:109 (+) Transcript_18318:130-456(+)